MDEPDFSEILKNRDIEKLEKWYAWAQEHEGDGFSNIDLETFYWWLRSDFGDTNAIAKLREMTLSENVELKRSAFKALGYALRTAEEYRAAADALMQASLLASDHAERATTVSNAALALVRGAHFDDAVSILRKALASESEPEARKVLFENLAQVYKKSDDFFGQALSIEQMLHLVPNDAKAHFSAELRLFEGWNGSPIPSPLSKCDAV